MALGAEANYLFELGDSHALLTLKVQQMLFELGNSHALLSL
jgi:hypothetical protein